MARYNGPRLKIIRRFQQDLPGLTGKTAENRPYPPGQHGPSSRSKPSAYRIRLDEKQKVRYNYGLTEKQLRRYVNRASRTKGDAGEVLLCLLEGRLDNLVFRAGFAPTIPAARQLVGHGHITVNGKVVDIPSMGPKPGDVIGLAPMSKQIPRIAALWPERSLELPASLSIDEKQMRATLVQHPTREQVPFYVQENLIVEYYSRVG
jgi:small subunit ribosomal protein S4